MWRFGKSQAQENQKPEVQKEEKVKTNKETERKEDGERPFSDWDMLLFMSKLQEGSLLENRYLLTNIFKKIYLYKDLFTMKLLDWNITDDRETWPSSVSKEPHSEEVIMGTNYKEQADVYDITLPEGSNVKFVLIYKYEPGYNETIKIQIERESVGHVYYNTHSHSLEICFNAKIVGTDEYVYYGTGWCEDQLIFSTNYYSYFDLIAFSEDFVKYINGEARTIACFSDFAERSEWMKGDDSATDHNSSSLIPTDYNYDGVMNLLSSIVIKFSSTTESHPEVWKKFAGEGQPTEENPLYWYTQLKLSNDDVAELDVTENANAWYVYNFFRTLKEQFVDASPVN